MGKWQALVVRKVDKVISANSVVCFVNIYPLDSDLSDVLGYPAFEQQGPDRFPELLESDFNMKTNLVIE